MVKRNGRAWSSSLFSSYPSPCTDKRNETAPANSTQPAIVPRSVHPPKITAAMAMNPRPLTVGSNCPICTNTR